MADVARWGVVDPLSEKYYEETPYSYVANNPIKFIDPDGLEIYVIIDGEAVLANEENLKGTKYYDFYKAATSTKAGRKAWDAYANNDEKDIYFGLSENIESNVGGVAINGLNESNLDQDNDGKFDSDIGLGEEFDVFAEVDITNSEGKDVALISLNDEKFSDKSETGKFEQSEIGFHELMSHVYIDDRSPGNGHKNHVQYGVRSGVNVKNWGRETVDPRSPAGRFVKQLLETGLFQVPDSYKKSVLESLKKIEK